MTARLRRRDDRARRQVVVVVVGTVAVSTADEAAFAPLLREHLLAVGHDRTLVRQREARVRRTAQLTLAVVPRVSGTERQHLLIFWAAAEHVRASQ